MRIIRFGSALQSFFLFESRFTRASCFRGWVGELGDLAATCEAIKMKVSMEEEEGGRFPTRWKVIPLFQCRRWFAFITSVELYLQRSLKRGWGKRWKRSGKSNGRKSCDKSSMAKETPPFKALLKRTRCLLRVFDIFFFSFFYLGHRGSLVDNYGPMKLFRSDLILSQFSSGLPALSVHWNWIGLIVDYPWKIIWEEVVGGLDSLEGSARYPRHACENSWLRGYIIFLDRRAICLLYRVESLWF